MKRAWRASNPIPGRHIDGGHPRLSDPSVTTLKKGSSDGRGVEMLTMRNGRYALFVGDYTDSGQHLLIQGQDPAQLERFLRFEYASTIDWEAT